MVFLRVIMGTIFKIMLASSLAFGGWWLYDRREDILSNITPYIESGEFFTLEARYTPQQIMEAHKAELLPDTRYAYQEPKLLFFPYLLMQVKYTYGSEKKTKEGILLWSLVDGEMVLNSNTWDTSHGFEDAIIADANERDFALLIAIAKRGGGTHREAVLNDLGWEPSQFDRAVESAKKKHLIISRGGELLLHFQNPVLPLVPETKIQHRLVKKSYSDAERVARRYRKNEVEKVLTAAFGSDFSIRSSSEVYLPIYNLEVLNPDGSHHSSLWNALTNRAVSTSLFYTP